MTPGTARRSSEAGFTLIETLVALAILAMSAVALLSATQSHVARIADLESRAAAQWVAENQLAEQTLGLPVPDQPVDMLGIGFIVAVAHSATADPDLMRLDIGVTDPLDGRRYGALTGFVDVGKPGRSSAAQEAE